MPTAGGPLAVRTQHPAQLLVPSLPLRRAAVLPQGSAQVSAEIGYSSLFLGGQNPQATFVMDGEFLRTSARFAYGLGHDLELLAELPIAHASGGFLDSFLIHYHDWFGLPEQDRTMVDNNQFRVHAQHNGTTYWELERDGLHLMDVPVNLLWSCSDRELGAASAGWAWAVHAGLELPTGQAKAGFGNGSLDTNIGVLAEYRGTTQAWYGQLQHTFSGALQRAESAGAPLQDVTGAALGVELPLTETLSALVQTSWDSATLRALPLKETRRDHWTLWVGGRWQTGTASAFELALGEDLHPNASPDFTAFLGWTWYLGR